MSQLAAVFPQVPTSQLTQRGTEAGSQAKIADGSGVGMKFPAGFDSKLDSATQQLAVHDVARGAEVGARRSGRTESVRDPQDEIDREQPAASPETPPVDHDERVSGDSTSAGDQPAQESADGRARVSNTDPAGTNAERAGEAGHGSLLGRRVASDKPAEIQDGSGGGPARAQLAFDTRVDQAAGVPAGSEHAGLAAEAALGHPAETAPQVGDASQRNTDHQGGRARPSDEATYLDEDGAVRGRADAEPSAGGPHLDTQRTDGSAEFGAVARAHPDEPEPVSGGASRARPAGDGSEALRAVPSGIVRTASVAGVPPSLPGARAGGDDSRASDTPGTGRPRDVSAEPRIDRPTILASRSAPASDDRPPAPPAEPGRQAVRAPGEATREAESSKPSSTRLRAGVAPSNEHTEGRRDSEQRDDQRGDVPRKAAAPAASPASAVSHSGTPMAESTARLTQPQVSTASESLTPAEQKALHARLGKGLGAAVRQGNGAITLRLVPEALGQVRISLAMDRGRVSVDVQAQNAAAVRAVNDSLPMLRGALEARGLEVDRLTTSLITSRPSGDAQSNQQNQQQASQDASQQRNGNTSGHDAGGGRSRGHREHTGDDARDRRDASGHGEKGERLASGSRFASVLGDRDG